MSCQRAMSALCPLPAGDHPVGDDGEQTVHDGSVDRDSDETEL